MNGVKFNKHEFTNFTNLRELYNLPLLSSRRQLCFTTHIFKAINEDNELL